MKIPKKLRAEVLAKYGGRCAYCGKTPGKLQVDHIEPIDRGSPGWEARAKSAENIGDLHPACARCNIWKHRMTLEMFRSEIEAQVERLRLRVAGFRIAEDFGLVYTASGDSGHDNNVTFYFEEYDAECATDATDYCPGDYCRDEYRV